MGAAYIFSQDDTGNWFQEARLALPEGESRPADIGLPGAPGAGAIGVGWFQGMALLGLPGRDDMEGAVYTYTYRPLTGDWVRGMTLSAFDRRPYSFFGHDFHTTEDELWISAPGTDFTGAIYRFTFDSDARTFGAAIKIANTIDPADGDGFGGAVATAGDLAIVGQPGNDGGLGSAVVMRNQGGSWVSEAKLLIPSEPGLPALVGGEIACGEGGKADQFDCSRVDILSFLPTDAIGGGRGTRVNDVWGWTDPETRREYALVGRTDGTAFIDITDPIDPVYLGDMPRTRGSQPTILARRQSVRHPCLRGSRWRWPAWHADLRPHAPARCRRRAGHLRARRALRGIRERAQHRHQRGQRHRVRPGSEHGWRDVRGRPPHDRHQ